MSTKAFFCAAQMTVWQRVTAAVHERDGKYSCNHGIPDASRRRGD
jgi:hypothetical protein